MEEPCKCGQQLGESRRFITNAQGQMGVLLCRDCANYFTQLKRQVKSAANARAARKAAKESRA